MKLSMWILKDWLEDFSPVIQCRSSKIELDGVRLYSAGMEMRDDTLYLGRSDAFFQDGGQGVVCKNRTGALRLQTEDLLTVSNRILDAFSFYNSWYDRCAKEIAAGCTLSDLLDVSAEVFSVPLMIVDAAQLLVAQTTDITKAETPEDLTSLERHRSLPEERLKEFNQLYKDSFYTDGIIHIPAGFFPTRSCCKHVLVNDERLATVILKAPKADYTFTTGTLHLLERFIPIVEEWVQCNAERAAVLRPTSYFTRTLDGSPGALPAMLRQMSLFGWENGCKKQVFVVCAHVGQVRFDMRLSRSLSNESLGIYAFPYRDQLVILCNLDIMGRDEAFLENLREMMEGQGCCGASSFPFSDPGHFVRSYHQALTALEHSSQAPGRLYRCQDVAMRMVAKIVDEYTSGALLHPALAAIKEHDRQYKTEYYRTLFCFLRNERRHRPAAEELFIHRNTLFQRLERIQALWPLDLDDNEERFYLLFSFYQDQYAKPARPQGENG